MRGVGPLGGAPVVGEPAAHVDCVAEDVVRGERSKGAAHLGHGRVLEESQPAGYLALGDQEPASLLQRQGGQVEARRKFVRSAGVGESLIRIPWP